MIAPQDQRALPFSPATPSVLQGNSLACQAEWAEDKDTASLCSSWWNETDGVRQTWSCTRGSFLVARLGNGTAVTSPTFLGSSATFIAPTDYTGSVRITCTVDDDAVKRAGEGGTRDDRSLVYSCVVDVKELPVGSIVLSTNKTVICAGALSSDVHLATVTATVRDTAGHLAGNRGVRFSWVAPGLPGLKQGLVNTKANGEATIPVVSGDEPGGFAVTAQIGTVSAQPLALTAEAPDVGWNISPDPLVADGQDHKPIPIRLTHHGVPVPGHRIEWHIIAVEKEGGGKVDADASGNFPGYGTLTSGVTTTDASGWTHAEFTAGTKPGTITFAADDLNVYEAAGQAAGKTSGARKSRRSTSRQRQSIRDTGLRITLTPEIVVPLGDVITAVFTNNQHYMTHDAQGRPVRREAIYDIQFAYDLRKVSCFSSVPLSDVNPSIFDVYTGYLQIRGLQLGSTTVTAMAYGQPAFTNAGIQALTYVTVRRQRQVTLNFYFCSDEAGNKHAPIYTDAINGIIGHMNSIWSQAPIRFAKGKVEYKPLPRRYGAVLTGADLSSIQAEINRPPGAGQINVYLVWKASHPSGVVPVGLTARDSPHVFYTSSSTSGISNVLAHEAGHAFNLPDLYIPGPPGTPRDPARDRQYGNRLMFDLDGTHLSNSEIDTAMRSRLLR